MNGEVSRETGTVTFLCRKEAPESLKNLAKTRGWVLITDDAEEAGSGLFDFAACHCLRE